MPQSNLLSYFSNPVTTTVPALADPRSDHQVPNEYVASRRHPSKRKREETEAVKRQVHRSTTHPVIDALGTRYSTLREAAEASLRHFENSPESKELIECGGRMLPKYLPGLPSGFIAPVEEEHLPAIRRLTSTILPVRYGNAFFTDAVRDSNNQKADSETLARVALHDDEPVGWIRCRSEPCSSTTSSVTKATSQPSQIYIQALAVLAPFRDVGIATSLLDAIVFANRRANCFCTEMPAVCIYAHVWEKNEDALDWYAKRGFQRVMLVERYYMKLKPSGAWIVRKELDGKPFTPKMQM